VGREGAGARAAVPLSAPTRCRRGPAGPAGGRRLDDRHRLTDARLTLIPISPVAPMTHRPLPVACPGPVRPRPPRDPCRPYTRRPRRSRRPAILAPAHPSPPAAPFARPPRSNPAHAPEHRAPLASSDTHSLRPPRHLVSTPRARSPGPHAVPRAGRKARPSPVPARRIRQLITRCGRPRHQKAQDYPTRSTPRPTQPVAPSRTVVGPVRRLWEWAERTRQHAGFARVPDRFRPRRHRLAAATYRATRGERFATWRAATGTPAMAWAMNLPTAPRPRPSNNYGAPRSVIARSAAAGAAGSATSAPARHTSTATTRPTSSCCRPLAATLHAAPPRPRRDVPGTRLRPPARDRAGLGGPLRPAPDGAVTRQAAGRSMFAPPAASHSHDRRPNSDAAHSANRIAP